MKKLNNKIPVIETSEHDDFLYQELMDLLQQHKLLRGAVALNQTLKDHHVLSLYLISKQIEKINNIEQLYFNDDGSLNSEQVMKVYADRKQYFSSLQSLLNNI